MRFCIFQTHECWESATYVYLKYISLFCMCISYMYLINDVIHVYDTVFSGLTSAGQVLYVYLSNTYLRYACISWGHVCICIYDLTQCSQYTFLFTYYIYTYLYVYIRDMEIWLCTYVFNLHMRNVNIWEHTAWKDDISLCRGPYIYVYIYLFIIHTYIHTCIHVYMCIYPYTYIYIHAYIIPICTWIHM